MATEKDYQELYSDPAIQAMEERAFMDWVEDMEAQYQAKNDPVYGYIKEAQA